MTRRDRLPSVPTALRELNPQQCLFLAALIELGGGPQNGGEAALTAGYADNYEEAEHAARILLKSPKIMHALKDAIVHRFDIAASAAFETLLEICTNKKEPARARISAAKEIFDRAPSYGPVPSRSMNLNVSGGFEELLDKLDAQDKAAAEVVDVTPGAHDSGHTNDTDEADYDEDDHTRDDDA